MAEIYSYKNVRTLDNLLRPLLHNCDRIFSPFVSDGMRILDVGCGSGFTTRGLAQLVGPRGEVVAVDVQPQMLAMAAAGLAKSGLSERVSLVCADASRLDLSGRFHFVDAFWMVHEVEDMAGFFARLARHLHQGARVFIAEPRVHVGKKAFAAMLEIARHAGFDVDSQPPVWLSNTAVLVRADLTLSMKTRHRRFGV